MTFFHKYKIPLVITALLFSTLACRAATSLIFPDTPAPQPTQLTSIPTLPPSTPTVQFEAACPLLLTDIMEEATTLNKNDTEENTKEETHLVTYTFRGERLHNYYLGTVPENLMDEQKDRATHEAIWNYFVAIIPPE